MAFGPSLLLGDRKMAGIARRNVDMHLGHASGTPNPFHKTPYVVSGQIKVRVNGAFAVTTGGSTACGDNAVGGSVEVTAGGLPVHRIGDATSGHGSWGPNACASGSGNVIAWT